MLRYSPRIINHNPQHRYARDPWAQLDQPHTPAPTMQNTKHRKPMCGMMFHIFNLTRRYISIIQQTKSIFIYNCKKGRSRRIVLGRLLEGCELREICGGSPWNVRGIGWDLKKRAGGWLEWGICRGNKFKLQKLRFSRTIAMKTQISNNFFIINAPKH